MARKAFATRHLPPSSVGRALFRELAPDGIENDDWVVIAAGGNTSGNTEVGAASAEASVYGGGHVLAVGAVDVNNKLSEFSALATTTSDTFEDSGVTPGVVEHFIVAPGSGVCVARTTIKAQGSCAGSIVDSTDESYGTMSGASI